MEDQRQPSAFPLSAIVAIAAGTASYHDVRACVTLCHRIAFAYLKSRSFHSHTLTPFGLSLQDLAIDSIADLFESDGVGSYPQFRKYLGQCKELAQEDPLLLFASIRRLVCSAVNNRLFRIYGLEDSAIFRILRNLKLELNRSNVLHEVSVAGERLVRSATARETDSFQPILPPEFLVAELSPRLGPKAAMPEILYAVSEILDAQTEYRREVPLYQLAYAIKTLIISHGTSFDESAEESFAITCDEIRRLADEVLCALRASRGIRYLRNGRLTEEELSAHLSALRDILVRTFVQHDGDATAFFDVLHKYLPAITLRDYAERHRVVLEYFARSAKKEMAELLKKELQVL